MTKTSQEMHKNKKTHKVNRFSWCFDGIVEAIAVIGHSCDDPIKLHMDGV